mmetsp:Transcript_30856/g.52121  ORF Transcript_30856/g.52121 Transcript_30856/m.52121 type:complete len:210 (-) Transcript_30856:140-769(-)
MWLMFAGFMISFCDSRTGCHECTVEGHRASKQQRPCHGNNAHRSPDSGARRVRPLPARGRHTDPPETRCRWGDASDALVEPRPDGGELGRVPGAVGGFAAPRGWSRSRSGSPPSTRPCCCCGLGDGRIQPHATCCLVILISIRTGIRERNLFIQLNKTQQRPSAPGKPMEKTLAAPCAKMYALHKQVLHRQTCPFETPTPCAFGVHPHH